MSSQRLLRTKPIRTYIVAGFLGLAGVLVAVSSTPAQPKEERKATNLQVLPKDIPHDELIDIMGRFSNALGVDCDFCHTSKMGDNGREMDFASDSKEEKKIARQMIRMTGAINESYVGKIAELDEPRTHVQCATCHHGLPHPEQIEDVLAKAHSKGMATMDSTYRELRANYYGSAAYDFSEGVLIHMAYELSDKNSKDAMAILKLNEEFNPKSSLNTWAMGKLYLNQGDTTQAITQYKRALEYDPNNRRAKRDLDMLGVKP